MALNMGVRTRHAFWQHGDVQPNGNRMMAPFAGLSGVR